MAYMLVFFGGGLGSCARYALSQWLNPVWAGIPLGTLAANLLSCIILGIVGFLYAQSPAHPARLALATGFCGGFSTFSTFSGELLGQIKDGQMPWALLYTALSLLAGIACVWAGAWLGRQMR